MRRLKTEVGRKLQQERAEAKWRKKRTLPATRPTIGEPRGPLPDADTQANRMKFSTRRNQW